MSNEPDSRDLAAVLALRAVAKSFRGSVRDLLPIVAVIAVFQLLALRTSFPDLAGTLAGLAAVVVGLTLFIRGLELALFPLGETMAAILARKGSVPALLTFAFALGFGTTVAEPALMAVADEAARVRAAAHGLPESDGGGYALALRYTVAASVGMSLMLGVVRIVKGWPVHWFIVAGYLVVVGLTPLAPDEIIGIAYDSGGVTTGTITVPFVTALGVGLSLAVKGRNAMSDTGRSASPRPRAHAVGVRRCGGTPSRSGWTSAAAWATMEPPTGVRAPEPAWRT